MGFPVGYTEVFFPNLFLHTLSLLGFIRSLIFSLFRLLGLSDLLQPADYAAWPSSSSSSSASSPPQPPPAAVLLRELLPVVKFAGGGGGGGEGGEEAAESCAVCLYEMEGGEEIRWLANCRHIFHRDCLDRWMDHDQKTCPLCRTPFVPDQMRDEFNQRLWAASGAPDFYSEYGSV